MIAAFPHLGPAAIAAAQLFSYLEIPHIVPPDNGKTTLEQGIKISPEEMCLPFKFMAGNLKAAYDAGADTAIMVATCGPCRLGEYGELLKETLQKAGCQYQWVLIDSISTIGLGELTRRLRLLTEETCISRQKFVKGIAMGIRLIFKMDRLRKRASERAGYLAEPYEAVNLLHETDEKLKCAGSFRECFALIREAEKTLDTLKRKKGADPVKVLVVGEIYTSVEAAANGRLEEKLMKLGCSVKRHIDISWWIKYTLMDSLVSDKVRRLFLPGAGLADTVGGYGRETIAKILREKSCDGIIKIMPAGCMPEIVTKAFCEKLQKEKNYRILHLIYDEMSGEAGYETRIEAFVDMLERRKNVLVRNRHRLDQHRFGVDR